MKKLLWLIAPLLVIGVLWFSISSAPTEERVAHSEKAHIHGPGCGHEVSSSPALTSEFAADGSRIILASAASRAAHQRYLEAKERAKETTKRRDDAFKKIAASSTTEIRERRVDGFMERRDQEYRTLFDSWGLDATAIRQVLAIIREREIRLSDHRNEYFKDPSKRSKDYAANMLVEDSISQIQIAKILGDAHANELSKTENRLREAELAKVGIQLPTQD